MRPGCRAHRLLTASIVILVAGVAIDVVLDGVVRLVDVLCLAGAALGAVQLALARGWPVVTALLSIAIAATGVVAVFLGVRAVGSAIEGDAWAGNGVPALVFGLLCAQAVVDLRRRLGRA